MDWDCPVNLGFGSAFVGEGGLDDVATGSTTPNSTAATVGDTQHNSPPPLTPNPTGLIWILHNWSDEDYVQILRNCRKAIPEKTGKIVIVDTILQPGGDDLFDNTGMAMDLMMLTLVRGGKERTKLEWKKILNEGGFVRYNIIQIPALQSIIKAYPPKLATDVLQIQ
ncbi:xanthohumol 4-O-methyltransferase-like [Camellia sinensis]|uniref:xanthohumol 4-O-methyltransferase-like n=1 Tax=Camellia sinensis TaxID=4442 RepID=UPI001036D0F8|nr:xanthohumol 4-O-methyltransferase-like [Camellia sinensis]